MGEALRTSSNNADISNGDPMAGQTLEEKLQEFSPQFAVVRLVLIGAFAVSAGPEAMLLFALYAWWNGFCIGNWAHWKAEQRQD